MRRTPLTTPLTALALLLVGAGAADAASLTRIETRPFYGATVTIEEGVRVFRPLPPHAHIIINPDGKTPLNLTFEERNITVNQHLYSVEGEPGDDGLRYGGSFGYIPGRFEGHRGDRNKRGRAGGHMIHVPSAVRAGGGVGVK
jgi:hypothetical protein